MGNFKMSDVFNNWVYQKSQTENAPIAIQDSLKDYSTLVQEEGGNTRIQNVTVIHMDMIAAALNQGQTPASMDVTFIVANKSNECKYLLVDFKFNVTSFKNITSNVSNDSIKAKYNSTRDYILEQDDTTSCINTAFFVFKDTNFEQIRNAWKRRNLNNPKNEAIRQSDFEKIFTS